MTQRACSHCNGTGREDLPVTLERVLGELSVDVPSLTGAVAIRLGLTHQNTDRAVNELRDAGLAKRLPRTAEGYEWLALRAALHDSAPSGTKEK
jgi:hypothetical protein